MVLGRWKLVASENFDAVLREAGVSYVVRSIANAAKPTCIIQMNGNIWTITLITPVKSQTMSFELNKPFVHQLMDGRSVNSIVSWNNNELVQVDRDMNGIVRSITKRSVNAQGQLIMQIQVGNVTARRIFIPQ